jgi:hypothetical protein
MNRVAGYFMAACVLVSLAGCGREPSAQQDGNAARSEEVVRAGDISIRASAIQTRQLSPAIALRYGAAHDARTVLVVVSLRKGDDATSVSLPAKVTISVGDLLGRKQEVAVREMRDGELLDYVGVATVSPPDTLRFDVVVVGEDGKRHELKFNRDFF